MRYAIAFFLVASLSCSDGSTPALDATHDAALDTLVAEPDSEPLGTDSEPLGVALCAAECEVDDDCGIGQVCRDWRAINVCTTPTDWPTARFYGACRADDECPDLKGCDYRHWAGSCLFACREDADCLAGACVAGACEGCSREDPCPDPAATCGPSEWGYCRPRCASESDCAGTGTFCLE